MGLKALRVELCFVDLWPGVVWGVPGSGFGLGGLQGCVGLKALRGELCLVDLWPGVESLS